LSQEPLAGWFPDERLTIEESIEAYNEAPGWASFEEDIEGSLAAGMLAEIAVFDTDLVEVGNSDSALCSNPRCSTPWGSHVPFPQDSVAGTVSPFLCQKAGCHDC
jgi:hypothetical protein